MRLEELERELRAERPDVDPDFARRLDDWAAAGFPRGGDLDPRSERLRGRALPLGARSAWDRLRSIPARRLLAPAGAAATLIVVAGIAISQTGDGPGDGRSLTAPRGAQGTQEAAPEAVAPEAGAPRPEDDTGLGRAVEPMAAPVPGVDKLAAPELDDGGPRALGTEKRRVAQRVDLSLATPPEDFRDAADGVLDVVRDHRGFVLDSSVSGGDPSVEGAAPGRASFRLKIPASELQGALGALSDLGHVVSRTDGTEDITGRFVSAKRRIEAYGESRQRLLERLEDANTAAERDSIEAQLRIVEAQLEDAERVLGEARQRVRLAPVSVAISADESTGAGGGGDWNLGDALDDAGRVLETAAGVSLITAAVLVPIGLLALIAALGTRAVTSHLRRRTLDEPGL